MASIAHKSFAITPYCNIFIAIILSITVTACGINPVTKKREIQFVSPKQEIAIGAQSYSPARQAKGGDYIIDPELTAYIQSIGKRLAAVSDRPNLPYEFVVINNSTPNAWALPGGKIAFNRGLFYELNSEAELAAIMGHEIVHAAARHGAKNKERGIFLQGAMIAVGVGAKDATYGNLIVGGSKIGAQLISSKYSRDAESESDYYGMLYMKKAGYDPAAAVTLQETFLRLSKDRNKIDFISGLFASHPPSPARVAANKITLKEIGAGGEIGQATYAKKLAKLKSTEAAYRAYDKGIAALKKGDTATATKLAKQAIKGEPREARFHELLGDIALTQKKTDSALTHYAKAIKMQPDYFKPHIQSGIALYNTGKKTEAAPYLKRANELLPTAPGHVYLGEIAEARGETNLALQHYQIAAGSNSTFGKQAAARAISLDFPQNPSKYIKSGAIADSSGRLFAVIKNTTSLPIADIQIRLVKRDARTGRIIGQSRPITIKDIAPGKRSQINMRKKVKSSKEARLYRVVIEKATIAR